MERDPETGTSFESKYLVCKAMLEEALKTIAERGEALIRMNAALASADKFGYEVGRKVAAEFCRRQADMLLNHNLIDESRAVRYCQFHIEQLVQPELRPVEAGPSEPHGPHANVAGTACDAEAPGIWADGLRCKLPKGHSGNHKTGPQ